MIEQNPTAKSKWVLAAQMGQKSYPKILLMRKDYTDKQMINIAEIN